MSRALSLCSRDDFNQLPEFVFPQFTKLTEGNATDTNRTESDPFQLHYLVPSAGQQPPNLAVLPFGHRDFDPGAATLLLDRFDVVDFELSFGEEQPFLELLKNFSFGMTRHLSPVDSVNVIARMCQFLSEVSVIRHDQQTGGVLVQTPDTEQPWTIGWKEFEDRWTSLRITRCTQEPRRLVEEIVLLALELQLFAVQCDCLHRRTDVRSELRDRLAIDLHSSSGDQLFTFATRSQAALGKVSLKSHSGHNWIVICGLRHGG